MSRSLVQGQNHMTFSSANSRLHTVRPEQSLEKSLTCYNSVHSCACSRASGMESAEMVVTENRQGRNTSYSQDAVCFLLLWQRQLDISSHMKGDCNIP